MNNYEGTLILVKSKNPPVFNTPMDIVYTRSPRKHEAFWFNRGNLSMVKKLCYFDGGVLINTLNSIYILLRKKAS